MPEYLVSGRPAEGRRVTRRVEAESSDRAVESFSAEGHTDVVLHTDDVAALYTRQSQTDAEVSPEEFIAFRDRGGFLHSTIFVVRKVYAKTWWISLGAVLTLTSRRTTGLPWGVADYLSVACLVFPLVYSPLAQIRSPARRFDRLQEALAWGRWEEVLRLLPSIRNRIPSQEAAFIEAKALAGLGQLNEALEAIAPFADDPQVPGWLFRGRSADIYFAAREVDEALRCLEVAAADAPENPTVLLDLAGALLRYRRDATRAAELLAAAKTHAISDILCPIVTMTEGCIALERGRAQQAKDTLQKALKDMASFQRATPLVGIVLDLVRAYLALAHANLGDREAAMAQFRAAEPRLRALQVDELVRRCEAAIF